MIKLRAIALLILLGLLAGWTAQPADLTVTITRVDDRAYPQVVTYAAVIDESGLPVTGLTEADFALFEDGTAVLPAAIQVEEETITGLRLVLAIDLSTPEAVLEQVKTAARAFVNRMGPEDRLALVAFYDEVELVRDFTNNTTTLLTAIDELEPTGNYTTLDGVILEASNLISQFETGRRGLVILTDSKNNINPFLPDEVAQQVQDSEATLFLVGVETEKVRPENLEAIASQTKGLAAVVNPQELSILLQKIAIQLRQGYRVTFQANTPVDDAPHDLRLHVSTGAGQGQDAGEFIARTGQVFISLPGLRENQVVGGLIPLTAQILAPAPVTAVTYQLDGQEIATEIVPPFLHTLDSSRVPTGTHTITAMATDRVGNTGQTDVNVQVVTPLTVEAFTDQTEYRTDEEVGVQARIEALQEVAAVELYLDGRLVEQDTDPPYSFSFTGQRRMSGERVITVRARDVAGNIAEDSVAVRFITLSRAEVSWLRLLLAIIVLIITLLLLALLLWFLLQRDNKPLVHQLEVENLGNVISRYKLKAEARTSTLSFEFRLNGHKLPPLELEPEGQSGYGPPGYRPYRDPTPGYIEPGGQPQQYHEPQQQQRQQQQQQKKGGGLRDKVSLGTSLSRAILPLVDTVVYFLPQSIGQPLRQWSSQVRRVQQGVSSGQARVDRAGKALGDVKKVAPKGAQQAAGQASEQARQAAQQSDGGQRSEPPPPEAAPPREPPPPPRQRRGRRGQAQPQPAPDNGRQSRQLEPAGPRYDPDWVQTPPVEPQESLFVDVLVWPEDHRESREYRFKIISRPLDYPDAPPTTEEGTVQVNRQSWLRRRWTALFVLIAGLFILVIATLIEIWLLYPFIINLTETL